ncbi:hypothetical protein ALO91_102667 [Pseudomonas syringae pv. aceris]|uniref:Uncharacterized protein n=1 Tax=Pseudomonas syringae pv. aceris TaxID=199198 RepID=A0A0P9HK70_PSESX|nr:hypothetical protein ALO91_102667 [Pseudomonas syringae pv. aceris]
MHHCRHNFPSMAAEANLVGDQVLTFGDSCKGWRQYAMALILQQADNIPPDPAPEPGARYQDKI